jgi:hypothetical protein
VYDVEHQNTEFVGDTSVDRQPVQTFINNGVVANAIALYWFRTDRPSSTVLSYLQPLANGRTAAGEQSVAI